MIHANGLNEAMNNEIKIKDDPTDCRFLVSAVSCRHAPPTWIAAYTFGSDTNSPSTDDKQAVGMLAQP